MFIRLSTSFVMLLGLTALVSAGAPLPRETHDPVDKRVLPRETHDPVDKRVLPRETHDPVDKRVLPRGTHDPVDKRVANLNDAAFAPVGTIEEFYTARNVTDRYIAIRDGYKSRITSADRDNFKLLHWSQIDQAFWWDKKSNHDCHFLTIGIATRGAMTLAAEYNRRFTINIAVPGGFDISSMDDWIDKYTVASTS
ncbi:hypothetical protein BD769DRAFT_1386587 [Suillus cothurnatus]|nr:hypothetical protein BD769DRAFT_1386587 [Suillus cothurnatus]